MKNNNFLKSFTFLFFVTYANYVLANIIWPALFVAGEIAGSGILVGISVLVEALLFYWLLKNISMLKALAISIVGNIASTLLGSIIMAFAMLLWHMTFDEILGGTFSVYSIIANYTLMYLGSSFIELLTIKAVFQYPTRQLWVPVFVGNFLTYALVAIFKFHNDIAMILGI